MVWLCDSNSIQAVKCLCEGSPLEQMDEESQWDSQLTHIGLYNEHQNNFTSA